jgi:hypothetical protein
LNFLKFETDRIDECFQFVRQLKTEQEQSVNGSVPPGQLCVMATGGGAYKYYDVMKEVLGVEVLREDEMECLIIGQSDRCWTLSILSHGLSMQEGPSRLIHIHTLRSRFLHHRNPLRSLQLQRHRPDAIRPSPHPAD